MSDGLSLTEPATDDLITVEFSACPQPPHVEHGEMTIPQMLANSGVRKLASDWRQRQREELRWLVEHVGYAGFVPSADDRGWRFAMLADATLFRLTFSTDRI